MRPEFGVGCLYFAFMACAPTVAAGSQLGVPRVSGIVVDGSARDWPPGAPILIAPDQPDTEVGQRNDVDPSDLRLTVRTGWNDEYLFVQIGWSDDVLDVRPIPFDSVVWNHPSGRRRDRMYYHDNVHVRLWIPDRFFGAWLSPQPDHPLQWSRADPEDSEWIFLEPDAAASRDGSRVVIELAVTWEMLGVSPHAGLELDLEFVAPDADAPEVALERKEPEMYWLSWRKTVRVLAAAGAAPDPDGPVTTPKAGAPSTQ